MCLTTTSLPRSWRGRVRRTRMSCERTASSSSGFGTLTDQACRRFAYRDLAMVETLQLAPNSPLLLAHLHRRFLVEGVTPSLCSRCDAMTDLQQDETKKTTRTGGPLLCGSVRGQSL
jgi:hypothetical protein